MFDLLSPEAAEGTIKQSSSTLNDFDVLITPESGAQTF